MSSNNKTALVTGSSRGIGHSIALKLADEGFDIVVNYAGNVQKAEETVAAITDKGRKAIAVQADLSSEADIARLFTEIEQFGGVDVIVHNAGMMTMSPISAESLEDFDRTIATNLRSTFMLMGKAREVLPDGGRFIALSTSVLAVNYPNYGPYIASKAGVESLVRVFANEMRGRSITVNAVAPGPVATELFFQGKSEELIDRLSKLPPLERLGKPEDIANVVAFLAGPEGGWVNGQILRANGGFA
ncbi:SDR family oxidoreductase [Pokkaliibacter sp. CJK22405]|uniref:SDR family oxidoreductase n=1 Tax=Pokkaliibacter sp. CJK22405 TaxID=3384615 RepID=UPI003984D8C1